MVPKVFEPLKFDCILLYVFLHATVLSQCKYLYTLKEDPREDWTVSNWAFSLNKVIIIIIICSTISLSLQHCFTISAALFYCLCSIILLSLQHSFTVFATLFHCLCSTLSLSLQHSFTVFAALFHCLCSTLSLSLQHSFTVFAALFYCLCIFHTLQHYFIVFEALFIVFAALTVFAELV